MSRGAAVLELEEVRVHVGDRVLTPTASLTVAAGEIVVLRGPSGVGKTLLLRAAAGALPSGLHRLGRVVVAGRTLAPDDLSGWRSAWGAQLALVLQHADRSLDPLVSVVRQVVEVAHAAGASKAQARAEGRTLLREVGLGGDGATSGRAPHALSGGQRQRAQLAAVLAARPALLLADEPAASLDPVATRELVRLFRRLVAERNLGALVVTHDPALADAIGDRQLHLAGPHPPPVRRGPAPPGPAERRGAIVVAGLSVRSPPRPLADRVPLVEAVSFTLPGGEALALMGASGAGKSTVLRALAGQLGYAGHVAIDGSPLPEGADARLRRARAVQLVPQDPGASFDPRQPVGDAIAEVLAAHGRPASDTPRLLAEVGLEPDLARRRPGELSGGQVQRAALARALAPGPAALLLDEPTSALDPTTRDAVLDLVDDLRLRTGCSLVVVTHDLAVARRLADRVVVVDAGRVVHDGRASDLASAGHPAVRALTAPLR